MRRLACTFAFLAGSIVLVGCDKKAATAERARVTGTVTLDNKPLTTGTISFEALNGEPPSVFELLDGKYEGLVAVGKNKVRLTAVKKVSMKEKMGMDGPGYDTLVEENMLPDRYADGTITREVTAAGPNTFDFDLKSK